MFRNKSVSFRKIPDGELKEDAQLQFQAQLSPCGIASLSHPFLNSKKRNTHIQRIDNKKLKKKKKKEKQKDIIFIRVFQFYTKKKKKKKLQLDVIRTLNP